MIDDINLKTLKEWLPALRTQYQIRGDAIVPRNSMDAPTVEQMSRIRSAHYSIVPMVEHLIVCYEATKAKEQSATIYTGGDSETHTREPSDSASRAPDGRVMGVLPTPAPTGQPAGLGMAHVYNALIEDMENLKTDFAKHPTKESSMVMVNNLAVDQCITIANRYIAAIGALPKREIVALTAADKYDIADSIVTESRSKTDVVQDVFDELADRFEIRRKP